MKILSAYYAQTWITVLGVAICRRNVLSAIADTSLMQVINVKLAEIRTALLVMEQEVANAQLATPVINQMPTQNVRKKKLNQFQPSYIRNADVQTTNCNFMCNLCYKSDSNDYQQCVVCKNIDLVTVFGHCICENTKYILTTDSCVTSSSSYEISILGYLNLVIPILLFALQQLKIFFPLSIRMNDYAQIISLYTFIGFPYLYDVQRYFNTLRVDNFNNFPNIVAKFFSENYNRKSYIVVDNQQSPSAMMQNKLSSSFFVNYSPILLAYFISLILLILFKKLPLINIYFYYLKKFFKFNSLISIFLLTFQETILYIALQLSNISFSNAFNAISFSLCVLITLALIGQLCYYAKHTLSKEYELLSLIHI
eukprot:TRINITY_DN7108_c0_g1_i2.p1 TRINITY_DN7108_c0_g1~~TRINITY_DN7108_c0_g1_i2.p1  ORF type:complete len:368 (-),score=31.36 TRINITY_DN7108_c0_g1_i2:141-1244(-)